MAVNIRWIDLDEHMTISSLMVPEREVDVLKRKVLGRLGITIGEGEKPYRAWLRAMCEENGLEFSIPVPREVADAILEGERSLKRFNFWLA